MTQYSINSLELENFRSYSKKTNINFGSKITLIFGKGSAGKSTIIDALQMLHASDMNDVDLFDKNSKYILSKNSNSKEFKIKISCSERDLEEKKNINSKSILKIFTLDKKDTLFPKKIEVFSDEGEGIDQKFLAIENEPLSNLIDRDKTFKDFLVSKVSFIENKYAYKELFEYTLKYKNKLLVNLDKCEEFRNDYNLIGEAIDKAKKGKKFEEADELEKKMKDLFGREENEVYDDPSEAIEQFRPGAFPFGKDGTKITKYKKFIEKLNSKIQFDDFIKFVADDFKDRKRYLYKNNRIFNDYDLFVISENKSEILKEKLRKYYERNIPSVGSTLLEFLCFCLTDFCNMDAFDPDTSYSILERRRVSKDSFTWGDKIRETKALGPREMMRFSDRIINQTLNQIKTIRHQENLNNIIRNLSQYSISSLPASDFAEQIETNLKTINKWLGKFEFDFKVSVERVGIKGEPVIMHNKGKYKIPAEIGGSGAQFLLTYLTSLIDSEESTILLEEPEKALHASLQIKLAEFFSEICANNQLVIETHSENLLLGILKQVRDKKIKPEELSVLYVYMENGVSKIDKLEVNEKGGFKSKWRDGFFTEKLDLL